MGRKSKEASSLGGSDRRQERLCPPGPGTLLDSLLGNQLRSRRGVWRGALHSLVAEFDSPSVGMGKGTQTSPAALPDSVRLEEVAREGLSRARCVPRSVLPSSSSDTAVASWPALPEGFRATVMATGVSAGLDEGVSRGLVRIHF